MRGAVGFNEMGDVMAASVGEIVKTSVSNRHVAYLWDFDPATDEVIVVKKDAARVWIDKGEEDYCVHFESPSFDDSLQEWDSSNGLLVGSREGAIDGIGNNDCVEFVAVKTYRPPVEHEAKLPEPVAELSDEAKVRAVYPFAGYGSATGCIRSDIEMLRSDYLSESFPNPDAAWADAARKLEQVTEPNHDLPPGCSTEIVSAPVPSAGQGVATCS